MKAKIFNQKLIGSLKRRRDIIIKKFSLKYKNGKFEFLRIASKQILKQDKIILITAGFHGDEKAGSLSILEYANKIIDYAHKKGLKIIIYPLINPSGFEKNTRYNIDKDHGEVGNSDFIRYELKDGKIIDDLGAGKDFKKWYWSSDKKFKHRMPRETQLVHKLLKKEPLKQISAIIDLHQNPANSWRGPYTYQYAFENKNFLKNIAKKISKILPIIKNEMMDAEYYGTGVKTDNNGFIVRHDGCIADLFYRINKYSVTVETTTSTPIDKAMLVNLTWIIEIINLINSK